MTAAMSARNGGWMDTRVRSTPRGAAVVDVGEPEGARTRRRESTHLVPVVVTSRDAYAASRGDRGHVRTVRPYRPPYFSPLALALDALGVIHANGHSAAHPLIPPAGG